MEIAAFIMIWLLLMLIPASVGLVSYIFTSIAQMRMLSALNFKSPIYAWIPFAREYALGWIAEQHDSGKAPKKHGRNLLILFIASKLPALIITMLVAALLVFVIVGIPFSAMGDIFDEDGFDEYDEYFEEEIEISPDDISSEIDRLTTPEDDANTAKTIALGTIVITLLVTLLSVVSVGIIIGYAIYKYILIYKIYQIFDPKNAALYIVIDLAVTYLLSLNITFVLFFIVSSKQPQNIRSSYL